MTYLFSHINCVLNSRISKFSDKKDKFNMLVFITKLLLKNKWYAITGKLYQPTTLYLKLLGPDMTCDMTEVKSYAL